MWQNQFRGEAEPRGCHPTCGYFASRAAATHRSKVTASPPTGEHLEQLTCELERYGTEHIPVVFGRAELPLEQYFTHGEYMQSRHREVINRLAQETWQWRVHQKWTWRLHVANSLSPSFPSEWMYLMWHYALDLYCDKENSFSFSFLLIPAGG